MFIIYNHYLKFGTFANNNFFLFDLFSYYQNNMKFFKILS